VVGGEAFEVAGAAAGLRDDGGLGEGGHDATQTALAAAGVVSPLAGGRCSSAPIAVLCAVNRAAGWVAGLTPLSVVGMIVAP